MKNTLLLLCLLFSINSLAYSNIHSYKVGTTQTKVAGSVLVDGHSQSINLVDLKEIRDIYKFKADCGSACGGSVDDLNDYTAIGDYSKVSVSQTDVNQHITVDAKSSGEYCDVSIDVGGMTIGYKNGVSHGYEKNTIVDTSVTQTDTTTSFTGEIFDGHTKVGDVSNIDTSSIRSTRDTKTISKENYTEYTLERYVD